MTDDVDLHAAASSAISRSRTASSAPASRAASTTRTARSRRRGSTGRASSPRAASAPSFRPSCRCCSKAASPRTTPPFTATTSSRCGSSVGEAVHSSDCKFIMQLSHSGPADGRAGRAQSSIARRCSSTSRKESLHGFLCQADDQGRDRPHRSRPSPTAPGARARPASTASSCMPRTATCSPSSSAPASTTAPTSTAARWRIARASCSR